MANINTTFNGYDFGNTFYDAIQKSLQRSQEDKQFSQKMASEERQQSLLNLYQQANLKETERYHNQQLSNDFVEVNIPEGSPIAQQLGKSGSIKLPVSTANEVLKFMNTVPKTTTPEASYIVREGDIFNKGGFNVGQEIPTANFGSILNSLKPDTKSNELTANQQLMQGERELNREERRQNKFDKENENVNNMLSVLQSGNRDANGNIQFNNNSYNPKLLSKIYAGKVNSLINTAGIKPTVNSLLTKARLDNPRFESMTGTEKRNILKKLVDNFQGMPDNIKDVLYKFSETYRD